MIKKPWLKSEEKELLSILHKQIKFPDWKEISKSLKTKNITKTAQQCCNRWYNNKNKKNYKIKFSEPKKKFSLQEEKKLLKLSFAFAPNWKRISEHFIDRNRFDVTNHFYCIVRKGLRKAFRLLGKKNSSYVLWKIKPKLYSILIKQDIKIDFREYKKSFFGQNDRKCRDFAFIHFYDFVINLYFNDYEDIWDKIYEREVFIIKKVFVYIMDFNLKYNREGNMTDRKKTEFLTMEKLFLEQKNNIIKSFDENNFAYVKIPGTIEKNLKEEKFKEEDKKIFSFQKKKEEEQNSKIKIKINKNIFQKIKKRKNLEIAMNYKQLIMSCKK